MSVFKVKNGLTIGGATEYTLASTNIVQEAGRFDDATRLNFFITVSQNNVARDVKFSSDGTKMYVLGFTAPMTIFQYNLSTAWDTSTAVYSNKSINISTQTAGGYGLYFKPDGTEFYLTTNTVPASVLKYTMSTAWDISTTSYSAISFDISAQSTSPIGIAFKPDGTKFYITSSGPTSDTLEYNLATAWNISTASFNQSFASGYLYDIKFNDAGTVAYALGYNDANRVRVFSLSTAWDISTMSQTATYGGHGADTVLGFYIKDDLTKMYLADQNLEGIHEFSLVKDVIQVDTSSGNVLSHTLVGDTELSFSTPNSDAEGLLVKLTGGESNEGWDLNSVTDPNKSFDFSTQVISAMSGFTVKPDGSRIYVVSSSDEIIHEYAFTVAWDITSLQYIGGTNFPTGPNILSLNFKPDGTKLYILADIGSIYEYNLSTPWDLSTASYVTFSSVRALMDNQSLYDFYMAPEGAYLIAVRDDDATYPGQFTRVGMTTNWSVAALSGANDYPDLLDDAYGIFMNGAYDFYVYLNGAKEIKLFRTTSAYSASTSVQLQSFSLSSKVGTNQLRGIRFSPDGKNLYVGDYTTKVIYQFTISVPATVTYPDNINFIGGTPASPDVGEIDVLSFVTDDVGVNWDAKLSGDAMQ